MSSSEDRSFTNREMVGFGVFVVLGTLIGIGAYQIGYHRISGVSGGGAEMSANTTNSAKSINGQALYASNCTGCHGAKAEGAVGPALATAAGWSAAEFKKAVMEGIAPTKTLSPVMPHFGTTGLDGAPATDEQVNAIHEYLASLK